MITGSTHGISFNVVHDVHDPYAYVKVKYQNLLGIIPVRYYHYSCYKGHKLNSLFYRKKGLL